MKHNGQAMPRDIHTNTHTQRLLDLTRQKGLLRSCDLLGAGVARVALTRLVATGQIEKVGRGLYRLPQTEVSEHDSLALVATQVPQAVFCLLTALQFHGLTTQLARQVWLAMPRGSHAPKITYPPTRMVQFTGEAYTQGVEVFERDHAQLRVYSAAKTVADCFKHRHKIGLDVALEALKEARTQRKATAEALWHFAKICRVANVMRPYLEATA
jgi:predicted transcriptional regulator of viral defense system